MRFLPFFLFSLLINCQTFAQSWTWDRNPEAGQTVMIGVEGLPMDEAPFHIVVYFFDGTELQTIDAGLLPAEKADAMTTSVAVHDHASWMCVAIKDQYRQVVATDHRMVKNDKALPKAALVEEALGSSLYARYTGISTENADVVALFREATTAYPQWLDNAEVFRIYYSIAKKAEATDDMSTLKTHAAGIEANPKNASEAMMVNAYRATKDLGDSTLALSLRKKTDKKYPKSVLAQEDAMTAFNKTTALDEKIKLRDKFNSQFAATKDSKRFADQMTGVIAQEYASQGDWVNAKKYIEQLMDPMVRAGESNEMAWTLSGESTNATPVNLEVASALSASSLALLSPDNPIPPGFSKNEWTTTMDNYRGMYGDTYALILYHQGKYEEAVSHQSFAVTNNHFGDGEMNERYVVYLEKAGRTAEQVKIMDQLMVTGKATANVKNIHKQYWTNTASKDKLYDQYLLQLENQAQALREEHIMKMWEDTDAPAFSLVDLNGQKVSLADYKGKTVILDFWATWCGPCKASFPGMKMAVEHFASDNDVVFLFIATWENPQDAEKRVGDFIQANNYPFHVLMDGENKVVSDYHVNGIPTKFIVGPDQKIHFTSTGFSGNNEQLLEEIKTMVQLVRTKEAKS